MSLTTESGISDIGKIPWGTHFCQLYADQSELAQVVVPYFLAGLENHERCIWVTARPYDAKQATAGLSEALPKFKRMKTEGQITICGFEDWYLNSESSKETSIQRWLKEEEHALESGYRGLRMSGNTSFVDRRAWDAFMEYEKCIQAGLNGRRVIVLCSYDRSKFSRVHDCDDVLEHHHFGIGRNHNGWDVLD